LYIDPAWQTEGGAEGYRWAGFWGEAATSGGNVWPIIEFTTLGGQPSFRFWESVPGGWHEMGLPEDFAWGEFQSLTITLQSDGHFRFDVGDLSFLSASTYDAASIDEIILQGYNQLP